MRTGLLACVFLFGCDDSLDPVADAAEWDDDALAYSHTVLKTGYGAGYGGTPYQISPAPGEEGYWGAQFMGVVPPRAFGSAGWKVTSVAYVLIDNSQGSGNTWCDSSVAHKVRLFRRPNRPGGTAIKPAETPVLVREWEVPAASSSTGPRFVYRSALTSLHPGGIALTSGDSLFMAVEMVAPPGASSNTLCLHTRPDTDGIDASWFSSSTGAPYGWDFLGDLVSTDVDYGFEVTLHP